MFKQVAATAYLETRARFSTYTWTGLPRPASGTDVVRAAGHNAHHVLLIGGATAVGIGTTDHQVALAGQLARHTAQLTGRGVDLRVIAELGMTPESALEAVQSVDLDGYDVIVFVLGTGEAFRLATITGWTNRLHGLLDDLREIDPVGPAIVLAGIEPQVPRGLPRLYRDAVLRRIDAINEASRRVVAEYDHVYFSEPELPPTEADLFSTSQWHYEETSRAITPTLVHALGAIGDRSAQRIDEERRLAAVNRLDVLTTVRSPELEELLTLTKSLLNASGAALQIVGDDRVWVKCADGMPSHSRPREHTMCDLIIGTRNGLMVGDLESEPGADRLPSCHGVRFFGAYPIESPDGFRVGSLCVVDGEPREINHADESLLRELAHRIEDELFREELAVA